MNNADTIDLLQAELSGHHNTHSVEDVLARGHALRNRRRRSYALATAAVVAAAGITALTTVAQPTPAFADWSSTPEAASADVVAAIDASCRRQLGSPAEATLAVVDRRGSNAVAVYTSQTGDYQCTRFQGSGAPGGASWWVQGGGSGPTAIANPAGVLEVVNNTAGSNVHEGSMTAISGRVQPGVARVSVSVSGRVIDGALGAGAFDVWWPAVGAVDAAVTITAYAANGATLDVQTITALGLSSS